MGRIYEDITATVGCTPLVKLGKIYTGSATILGKCEFFNPCGSVKDRIGVSMIEAAEKTGKIVPGSLIVEPTSGNTGIALAFVCASRGYRLTLTMPESMSIERRKLLKMFGADIVLTPADKGMQGAIDRAVELVESTPGAYMPQQFQNPANPQAHRETTAEEIWADTGGKIDMFVAGVGTGGTLTGCCEVLKAKNPDMIAVAVEPTDSPVLSGGKPGPHKIQGIGAGFVPDILNSDIIDEIVKITAEEAIQTSQELAQKEGVLVGISAGANVAAAIKEAEKPENEGKTIVTILCDTGERYISTELFR